LQSYCTSKKGAIFYASQCISLGEQLGVNFRVINERMKVHLTFADKVSKVRHVRDEPSWT